MANTDKKMNEVVRNIIDSFGVEIFKDARKASAIVADCITDNSLEEEKVLLKRVIASGAMGFVATTNKDNYLSDRQKALYILTEREFIAESWAEKALSWFDGALGCVHDELEDEMDFIHQLVNASKEAEKEKKQPSCKEFLSPIDMLLDEDNNDNIVLFNEDNQPIEFEQIALVPIESRIYALLKPVLSMEGIGDDEALVFVIEEIDGEDCLIIVEEDEIIDKVFEEYYEMLRAEGIDVD